MGKVRVPLFFPVETRDLAAFSGGTPQKDQKIVNGLQETIGQQKWVVKRPGLFPYGSIGANALIDVNILEITNTQTFIPVTHTYTAPGAANEVVPVNASVLTIRYWGPGGGSGRATENHISGAGGGGAGGKITVNIAAGDWGQNIAYVVGAGGLGKTGGAGSGLAGPSTTVSSTGLSFPDLVLVAHSGAGGPTNGPTGGAGGVASGGDTNVSGNVGTIQGGNSATIDGISGSGGPFEAPGTNPGGGGGGSEGPGNGRNGAAGRVDFIWS